MEGMNDKKGGIRLRRLNRIMITLTIVLAVLLLAAALSNNWSFQSLQQATDRYILARKDAADMQAGSDYLTDRVRTFVATGDISCAEDFFREVEVTRRRELAMESMESALYGTSTARYLSVALKTSNQLADIERYALALAVAGYDLDRDALPATLQTIELTAEDQALSREEQLNKALDMVFNDVYQVFKTRIRSNIDLCEQALIGETETAQKRSARLLGSALTAQTLLIAVVVLVVLAIVLCNTQLVFRPIEQLVKAIAEDAPAPERGADELRFLTRAYNQALSESQESRDRLAYKAAHDDLTGLYNRGAFEWAKEKNRGRDQAMFIFDVDQFKQFNDEHGHDMGDRVLKKVADVLKHNFRDEDYVCRFGGDEFTVLMVHVTSAMRGLIEMKIEHIRAALLDTSDGMLPITLSIGVAFSDRLGPSNDILKDADTALYVAKQQGKDGHNFFDPTIRMEGKV